MITTKQNEIQILEYKPKHHQRFKEINVQWITRNFVMEDIDEKVLNNPDEYILKNGGAILIATYNNEIVGTCALTNEGDNVCELTKMGVDEKYRGLKIGYLLGVATLEKAKALGAKKVILYSNTVHSANAINLYRKLGFKEVPLDNALWVRADIKMEVEL